MSIGINKYITGLLIILFITMQATQTVAYGINAEFLTIENHTRSFSEYQGKMLIVDATASWCTSCDIQLQNLNVVYDSVNFKVSILTISIDTSDTIQKVAELKSRYDSNWEFGLDTTTNFQKSFPVQFLPTLYLFNENGAVLQKWEGITQPSVIIKAINANTNEEFIPSYADGRSGQSGETRSLLGDLFASPTFKIVAVFIILSLLYINLMPAGNKKLDITK